MDGVGNETTGVLVLGATNTPWSLDPAIRRRFERRIYIPLPEVRARLGLISNLIKNNPNEISEEDLELIAEKTEGYFIMLTQILRIRHLSVGEGRYV
jgi:vacuolar protein-sorting-associated protein 4